MIARIWRGRTPASRADEYFDYLKRTGIKDYGAIVGNRGMQVLRRSDGEIAEFVVISFWDSLEAIKAFAGDDYEKARYYPEDSDFLLELEPTVQQFEVVLRV